MPPPYRPDWLTYYDIHHEEELVNVGFDRIVNRDPLEVEFIQEDQERDKVKEWEARIVSCGAPQRPPTSDSAVVCYYPNTGTFYVQYFTDAQLSSYCYVPPDEAGLIISCYYATRSNDS